MAKLISAADQLCIKKTATVTEHPPFWKEHEVHVVLRLPSTRLQYIYLRIVSDTLNAQQ